MSEHPTSKDLLDLLRYRILDRRNNDETAMLRLMGEAADEIERLRGRERTLVKAIRQLEVMVYGHPQTASIADETSAARCICEDDCPVHGVYGINRPADKS